jgi:hypothetical protein
MIKLYNKIYEFFNSFLKDRCEFCHGSKGGTRGNENIFNGKRICQYCISDMYDKIKY